MDEPTPFRRRPPPAPRKPSDEELERLRRAAPPTSAGEMKKARAFERIHSGPGVGSFLLAIAALVLLGSSTLWAMLIELNNPGGGSASDGMTIGCMFLLAMLAVALGVMLGFIGVFEHFRKTLFAWLGLLTNALVAFLLFLLFGYSGL